LIGGNVVSGGKDVNTMETAEIVARVLQTARHGGGEYDNIVSLTASAEETFRRTVSLRIVAR